MLNLMLGSVRRQMDDKDRFRIPPKFRAVLGPKSYILPGRKVGDGKYCLYIVPEEKFEKVHATLDTDSLYANENEMDATTLIYSGLDDLEEDGQGRVRLNEMLGNLLNAKKDVVFVGKGQYLEMWAGEVWDERYNLLNKENVDRALENLKNRGV